MQLRSTTIILFAVVVILTTAEFSSAQTTAITEQDYWAGIRSGFATTQQSFPRRETDTYESLSGGKVTYSRTEISEYRSKDTFRTTVKVVRDGKTFITETIHIGMNLYCRENTAEWEICYPQPPPALDKTDETKYFVQKNKDSITYIRTGTSLRNEANKAEPTKFLTEDRLMVSGDKSVRERSIIRTVIHTKSTVSRGISRFEYGVTLKPIEAPIK
jgi:hypothetical protein